MTQKKRGPYDSVKGFYGSLRRSMERPAGWRALGGCSDVLEVSGAPLFGSIGSGGRWMSDLIYKAMKFAEVKHTGQRRKGSGADYITHPLAVSYLVASFKRSKHLDEIICAAILHDTLEDTDATFVELAMQFTPLVASLVQELTTDKEECKKQGKVEYLKKKMVGISNYGLVLKLCDRLHNCSDHPTAKTVRDTEEILDYLETHRTLSGTQQRLIEAIRMICKEKR